VYGVAAGLSTVAADVREVSLGGVLGPGLAQHVDAVFIDPARRAGGRRPPGRGSGTPPGLGPAPARAGPPGGGQAPARPPAAAARRTWGGGQAWRGGRACPAAHPQPATRATVLPGGHTLTPGPGGPVPVRPPGGFLLDPNPAVTRAGLVEDLARSVGAWKI